MESNAMPGGVFSSLNPGMIGLEMSLQHRLPPQHSTVGYGGDHHSQTQQPEKQEYPHAVKAKNPSLTFSDDDEHGFTVENIGDDRKKNSPWQRMKWTDNMVRLLIMVVYYIGDDAGGSEGSDKKKGGTVLQKKGKWKSVSRAMMEKGFYVSPQQCEDKFNDLNKRYKRVNDILGKGTACRVVENQSLLDSMDNLSMKMKEEVKKLLNSKHLFFREMCSYHNSCGHGTQGGGGGGGGGGDQDSPPEPAQSQQRRCLHSPEQIGGSKVEKGVSVEEYDEEDRDEDEDEDEDEEDEDDDDEDGADEQSSRKRLKKGGLFHSPMIQQFSSELTNMLRDGTRSPSEKRVWMERRSMQLEEQRAGFQCQAFEIEKRRLKWLKFSGEKEREMEREKLSNERLKLENERMVLLIRQKEVELFNHQQSSNKKSDPSSVTG